jgi:hypothetical protein
VRAIELESGDDQIEFAAGGTAPIANSREAADRWMDLAHYGGKGRRYAKRDAGGVAGPWVPAIHAPRWCTRLELELTASRIEPLNAITDEDAIAEGIVDGPLGWHVPGVAHPIKAFPILSRTTPRLMYAALWDTLHGSGEWLGNRSARFHRHIAGSGKTYNGAGSAVERSCSHQRRESRDRRSARRLVGPRLKRTARRAASICRSSAASMAIFRSTKAPASSSARQSRACARAASSISRRCQTKEAERRFMLAFLESALSPRRRRSDACRLRRSRSMGAAESEQARRRPAAAIADGADRAARPRPRLHSMADHTAAGRDLERRSLQADGLIAFKLTASQDRKAIGDWVRGQADEGQWPTLDAPAADDAARPGAVWLPARGVLETADFPPRRHSTARRRRSAARRSKRRELKPLDLESLKGRLSSIEEEAKANDPKALKAEISRLQRELAAAPAAGSASISSLIAPRIQPT